MDSPELKRVEHLEFLMAHLQKLYDDLNKVVFNQQRELELLRNHIARLDHGYDSMMEADRVPRSLADDRPPHY